MTRYELHVEELRARLNSHRLSSRLTWSEMAKQAGVDKGVFSRLNRGEKVHVDAVMSLIAYLDIHPGLIMRRTSATRPD